MSIQNVFTAALCGIGLYSSGIALGQQAQQVQQRPAQPLIQQRPVQPGVQVEVGAQAGQRGNHSMVNDQSLATCLAIGDQEEIAIGKFAQQKARNQEVKDFAGMMVKDHQAFLQKLQQFAPEAARDGFLREQESTATGQSQTSKETPRRNVNVQAAGGLVNVTAEDRVQQTAATQAAPAQAGTAITFVQLHKELAEECLSATKQKLSSKSGKEFDECFIGFQIAAHSGMKDKLVVFERHSSPELQKVIAEGITTTDKHLKRAEELMKKLADKDNSSSKDK